MKPFQPLLICLFILKGVCASYAHNATNLITQGRAQLRLQSPAGLAQADKLFGQALVAEPNNLEANFFKAATSLLLEQSSPQFQAQLNGVGVTIKNNDIYNLSYTLPFDEDGFINPRAGVTTNNSLAYINGRIPLIDAALANLAKFSPSASNFKTVIRAEETSLDYVQVDYGDVLIIRSLLKTAKAFIALMNTHNINADYTLVAKLLKNGELTPQKILQILPDAGKFADSSQRAAAKTLLVSANADYQSAHAFIKNSRQVSTVPYLFEYDDITEAERFANEANGIVSALNSSTNYTLTTLPAPNFPTGNVTINPNAFFTTSNSIRSFLTSNTSAYSFGYPSRVSWPDTTFGGLIVSGSGAFLDALDELFNSWRLEQRLLRLRMRPQISGSIRAWGSNSSGQISVPAGLSNVVQISAGGNHTLALNSDGSVMAWGNGSHAQSAVPLTVVSTIAGNSFNAGWQDGSSDSAVFNSPQSVAVDDLGNIYIADTANNAIRKISPAGLVSTLVDSSSSGFNSPRGIAVDQHGAVYVADTNNNLIRKITPGGTVTTLAGGGAPGQDGIGSEAGFSGPEGIAVDLSGNVFVADTINNKIRKVSPTGLVTSIAGDVEGYSEGTGSSARFSRPQGIAVDSSGTLFVADTLNNRIRRITTAGVVTTLAGSLSGNQDGAGSAARFDNPRGIVVDSSGNLIVSDQNNNTIRRISSAGVVSTIAGSSLGGAALLDGAGASASFNRPAALALDRAGNIHVADANNHSIRKITALTGVNQIAAGGYHSLALLSDGRVIGWGGNDFGQLPTSLYIPGTSLLEELSGVVQIAAGERHSIALTQRGGVIARGDTTDGQVPQPWESFLGALNDIVQITAGGNHSFALRENGTLVSWGSNARGQSSIPFGYSLASFSNPAGMAIDSSGNLFIADSNNNKIRRIAANGTVTTLAGSGNWGSQDGLGASASFQYPTGIAVDSSGVVFVADSNNNKIRRIATNGTVTTLAGSGDWGSQDGPGASASFAFPQGIAISSNGTIFVADSNTNKIRRIAANGTVTTLAGSGNWGSQDGPGASASFQYPTGIAVDSSGVVFVADSNNNKIRRIATNGTVTTLAGSGDWGSQDGPGASASFAFPQGIAISSNGTIFVADSNNYKIRRIATNGTVTTLAGSGDWGRQDGPSASASFAYPQGIAVNSSGNIFLSDSDNNIIRGIATNGTVTTFSGSGLPGSSDGVSRMSDLNPNKITQIAAGGSHSLALTSNGTVLAWGDNSTGQTAVPAGLGGVVQVAAGRSHSIALLSNGTIRAWGQNTSNQTSVPGGITNPIQISGGGSHSLALMANSTFAGPEITVELPGGAGIQSNQSVVPFANTRVGSNNTISFTIRNTGTGNLTGLALSKNGTNSADFVLGSLSSASLPAGNFTVFQVSFAPSAGGSRSAKLSITNNDPDENPFAIELSGYGLSSTMDFDGDGVSDLAEHQMGDLNFDLQTSQPIMATAFLNALNAGGLFGLEQIQAMNIGVPLISKNVSTGQFEMTIGMQKSTNLQTFQHFSLSSTDTTIEPDGRLKIRFSAQDNAAFFRIQAK